MEPVIVVSNGSGGGRGAEQDGERVGAIGRKKHELAFMLCRDGMEEEGGRQQNANAHGWRGAW